MTLNHNNKSAYLIGIAGTAMASFAGLLKNLGYLVSGSDENMYDPMKSKLEQWGISVKIPYSADNVPVNADLVIVGNAISKQHSEAMRVLELGLKQMSFPDALREFCLEKNLPLVVVGTHGKTTCSSLLAHTLYVNNFDPGFLIGGIPQNFESSFRLPNQNNSFFVVEGDEYDTAYFDKTPKFLHYNANHVLATSLEFDHADIYNNLDEISRNFTKLFDTIPAQGSLIFNENEKTLCDALEKSQSVCRILSYGGSKSDYFVGEVSESERGLSFEVHFKAQRLGAISIGLNGEHNVQNALGCYALLHAIGLEHAQIAQGFATFLGVKRRMEIVAQKAGKIVVDDFAHHPTAVAKTIAAAKNRFKGIPIWALFEPRSATSCRDIFQDDYVKALKAADRVLLAPIGRKKTETSLNLAKIAYDLQALNVAATAFRSIDDIIREVRQSSPEQCVLLCMSNGSFGNIHKQLVE